MNINSKSLSADSYFAYIMAHQMHSRDLNSAYHYRWEKRSEHLPAKITRFDAPVLRLVCFPGTGRTHIYLFKQDLIPPHSSNSASRLYFA